MSLNVASRLAKALGTTCEAFAGCKDIAGADDAEKEERPVAEKATKKPAKRKGMRKAGG